jgi:nicotinate phosphoribosyltransferase
LVDVYSDDGPSYRAKLSGGKATYPGCKQVFRGSGDGMYCGDVIRRCTEDCAGAEPLLACVMRNGSKDGPSPSLQKVREYATQQMSKLPAGIRRLHNPGAYSVRFSQELERLLDEFRSRFGQSLGKRMP